MVCVVSAGTVAIGKAVVIIVDPHAYRVGGGGYWWAFDVGLRFCVLGRVHKKKKLRQQKLDVLAGLFPIFDVTLFGPRWLPQYRHHPIGKCLGLVGLVFDIRRSF